MVTRTPSDGAPVDIIHANHAASQKTYILPLTFPSVTAALQILTRMSYGIDIWELRADLLSESSSPLSIETAFRASNPIYDKGSESGWKWPDNASKEALEMLVMSVEAGCEYIDVEIEWPQDVLDDIVSNKGGPKIVASFHDWTGNIKWGSAILQEKFKLSDKFGDIIKLSIMSTTIYDSHDQALFIRDPASHPKPILAVAMAAPGQLARATSPISIVTHSCMPPSAPGQLTLAQVHQTMHLIGELPKRDFFIFGNNIAHSLSPALHNAGFGELGLPHIYRIYETENVDEEVRKIMDEPGFGGASVTFPHKLQIEKYLQASSESARLVGAVNTVVVKSDPRTGARIIWDDNTDWPGIKSCIEVNWPAAGGVNAEAAVIIGAGGASRAACYAVQQLGASKIYLINRTRSKSQDLVKDFSSLEFELYESMWQFPEVVSPVPSIVVGCVPADDFTAAHIPTQFFSQAKEGGVLVEMAYRPLVTALMRVARGYLGWKTSRRTDVLKGQAYHQFRMWTGRRAPVTVMADAIDAVLSANK